MRQLFSLLILLLALPLAAQETKETKDAPETLGGFSLRNVGPAFVSGRIADIAVHPKHENTWYVGVASGGVWKTKNAGITWDPIFDTQKSYAIGCITIDARNPATVWVGTGENVGGRHIAFGDGIYRSDDAGASWKNMGLPNSEHISKIIVHPGNSDVVWVAVQGPLWSKGGDRGLYKTTDGGKNWKKTLGNDEWTGATDLLIDPRNPDLLYAATWDRHRTVAAYMGGGPGSGIHRSRDGGETWEKIESGIPSSNLGKIGLAISPQDPDVVYAAVTLNRRKGGVYRSSNQGSSWSKMSDAVSGGTGPHYYQELYASPHAFDRIYLMDVRVQVSDDGGKSFRRLKERRKHSDNHALIFRADDPDYLLIGTDAGIYESYDLAENWRFIDNMPLTQYYKVAVDDREPFYHIYGGTQDNGSHGGPSRTDSDAGIRNGDWDKTLFADGHQSATEPGNPDIIYAETQQGGLHRVDLKTGEPVMVQPQARAGDPHERFNWDAPILVSSHDPKTLYFASYRVWKSNSRGDDWEPISGDLTRNEERIALPIMGAVQSWDNPWDIYAMSNYSTITSLAESVTTPGVVWAGTDDGILQSTADDGKTWNKMMVSSLPGVPERAFVNDIKIDRYDANKVYVCLDNHKEGDFKPYVYMTENGGKSWTNLGESLPYGTLTWRLVQDHVSEYLMFLGTENGIYVTMNGGNDWKKLAGSPTIPFRDLAIQKRENDLVGASFGRSFWVLDDYAPMREMTVGRMLDDEASLFSVRDAWWYSPRNNDPGVGADKYAADNPDFGAVFTYNLNTEFKSKAKMRKEMEKEAKKDGRPLTFAGYDAIDAENDERKPKIWLTVMDADGNIVRKISQPMKKGLQRVAWDLRYPSTFAISPGQGGGGRGRWSGGSMAPPGKYSVTLSKEVGGKVTQLDGPVSFNVKPLHKPTIAGADAATLVSYRKKVKEVQDMMAMGQEKLGDLEKQMKSMETALERSAIAPGKLNEALYSLQDEVRTLSRTMEGSPARGEVGEKAPPSVSDHFFAGFRGLSTTYGPTPNMERSLGIAKDMVMEVLPKIEALVAKVPALRKQLKAAGAPYMIGTGEK